MVATCERSPVTTRHTGKGTGAAKAEPLRTHYRRCRVWLIDTSSFTLTLRLPLIFRIVAFLGFWLRLAIENLHTG